MKMPDAVVACDGFFLSAFQLRVMNCSGFTIPMQLLTLFQLELYRSGLAAGFLPMRGVICRKDLQIFL